MSDSVSMAQRSMTVSLAYIAVHCAVALVAIFVAPGDVSRLPAAFLAWGEVIETIVPAVQYLPTLTSFRAEAWFACVVVWSLIPIAAVYAAYQPWLWVPDETRLRRQPWLLVFAVALFGLIAVGMSKYSPTPQDVGGYSFGDRALTLMIGSRLSFATLLGLIVSAVSMSLGFLPRTFSTARTVMKDDYRL